MSEINPTAASLLGFLQWGPMSGWDLAARAQGSVGYFWNLTRSQIYRELAALEKSGMVKRGKTGPRDRQPYSITPAGSEAFKQWIRREPPEELIRFPLLLTLFFGDHLEPERLARFLRIHRLRHEERLERYRELLTQYEKVSPHIAQTVRFGMLYEEGVLKWFDQLPELATRRKAEKP